MVKGIIVVGSFGYIFFSVSIGRLGVFFLVVRRFLGIGEGMVGGDFFVGFFSKDFFKWVGLGFRDSDRVVFGFRDFKNGFFLGWIVIFFFRFWRRRFLCVFRIRLGFVIFEFIVFSNICCGFLGIV